MMLADLGAEVIRVDRPPQARDMPFPDAGRRDPLQRSRRSIVLDLKQPSGIDALLRLSGQVDVLVESFRPGVMERLGLSPESCLGRNPRLIYARLTGWGQSGALAPTAGHDLNYLALSGLLHQLGTQGKPVVPLNVIGDFGGGGLLLAYGIVCAYVQVLKTGRGQVVDAAMIDGAASFLSMLIGLQAAGVWIDATGANWLAGAAHFYDTYRTRDGRYVAVGAVEPAFHRELLQRLGLEAAEFAGGEFVAAADYPQRLSNTWPRLKARLAAAIAARSLAELEALFAGSDACVTPVLTLAEAMQHPHNRARDTFVGVEGALQPAPAPRFSGTPAPPPRAAPACGADTRSVLAEHGFSDSEIEKLLGHTRPPRA